MAPGRTRHNKEIRHGPAEALFTKGILWRRPGNKRLFSTHRGARTDGQWRRVRDAGAFSAKRQRVELSMDGIDVLRVEDGRIAEVWLFSVVQEDEDVF